MPAIQVNHVTKEYQLGAMQSLRETLRNVGSRLAGKPIVGKRFKALDDVNFCVEPGEVVGIIGHNGAGKSTLLKMLARISTPSSGTIRVSGRIAPLIEVGAGFVGDFTGRENVYLNGSILGMSRNEINRKFDEIVDFAEMSQFIDTPVKRYSSGMQIKLAFAVATSVEAEILIVDEVLAVGDLAFQRKCFDRMESLIKRQQRTVLLVSHNIRQVERLCTRVMVVDKGRITFDGDSRTACNKFLTQSDERIRENIEAAAAAAPNRQSTGEIELLRLEVRNHKGEAGRTVTAGESAEFLMTFSATKTIHLPIIGFGFHTTDFVYLATVQSVDGLPIDRFEPGIHKVLYSLRSVPLVPGVYSLRVGVALGEYFQSLFYSENVVQVTVIDPSANLATTSHPGEGFVRLDGSWQLQRSEVRSAEAGGVESEVGSSLEAE